MLKQLLKYEFKATKRLYFGLYLALALLSVVLGVTFRQEHALAHSTSFQNLEVILMIVYVSVILAIAVLCFVNTIQRFYQNLLGREGVPRCTRCRSMRTSSSSPSSSPAWSGCCAAALWASSASR